MFQKTILKNGLRLITAQIEGTQAITALVLFKVGSRYETKTENGVSHFIEHMMFKGTKRRPTTLDISKELDSVGASYNAFTGKDYTGYYAKVPAENFSLAVDLLHDMIFHSKYSPAEMTRERKVIIEEINMYKDNPHIYIEDLLEMKMFEGNTLGWSIAGTRDTMTKMKRGALINFRDKNYVAENIVVTAAGKLPADAEKIIAKKFSAVLAGANRAVPAPFKNYVCSCGCSKVTTQFKDTQQVQLALGFI